MEYDKDPIVIYRNLIPSWNIRIDTCKIISLTFGNHVGEIQFVVGEIGGF
jgi:hypothetical protein